MTKSNSDIVDWENLSVDLANDDENETRLNCPFIDYEAKELNDDGDTNDHDNSAPDRRTEAGKLFH